MATLPTVVTAAGLQPNPPADILDQIITTVQKTVPGYTANLPGSLIRDISTTEVAGVSLADQARVDLVNSLTPFGANAFLLRQLGQMLGVPLGLPSNTSVFLQFTGTPGFVVGKGFTVSDGTYQYVVQDGGIIGTDNGSGNGVSSLLFAVATTEGSWSVPSGTVQSIVTSVPSPNVLMVNNPSAGIPAEETESEESYRARVLNAMLAVATGTQTLLKTLLNNVNGVQSRLISIIQLPANAGWEIIVGGGDPYEVAYAIYKSGIDLASLVGSTIEIDTITKANPGVATTILNHGLTTGDTINIAGSNPSSYDVTGATVTVIDEKTFSYGVNTTGFATYTGGGVLTPNNRNIVVSINDFPDTYSVPYVSPPQQTVNVSLVWNTSAPNFVSENAVAQAGAPDLADYVNSVVVGQPLNIFEMEQVFKTSIKNILEPSLVTRMIFSIQINGVNTPVTAGTGIVAGDPESYFFTAASNISIVQG